jgi:hypothetical protein
MARGWESKSVEAQQDAAAQDRKPAPRLTDEQRAVLAHRRTLELARARAAGDLDRATAPQHKRMLEQTLAAIDAQLAELTIE